jgi:hypothetical protein
VEEDDRSRAFAARLFEADVVAVAGDDLRHAFSRHAELVSASITKTCATFIKMDPETSSG